jgi:hypothetical protein
MKMNNVLLSLSFAVVFYFTLLHSPFSLDGFDDPTCGPEVVVLEIDEQLD